MTSMVKKTFLAGLAALTMGAGLAATATPADAQGYRWGHYRGNGYRPAYPGPRYGYYAPRRYNGGAVAAGVVGGLALGALAAGAVAAPAPVYGGECWIQRQPVTDSWGNVLYYQRVRVCN